MTVLTQPQPAQSVDNTPALRKITVEELESMYRAGIFHDTERLELLNGELYSMQPIGKRHMLMVNKLTRTFSKHLAEDAIVSVQNALPLDDYKAPQPDIALWRFQEDLYEDQDLTADDVLLMVEVADSSLIYDRETKLPLYAKVSIQEVWIVNLKDDHIEVYREPHENGYRLTRIIDFTESLAPLAFPNNANTWL